MVRCKSLLPLVLLPGFMLDETLWDDTLAQLGGNRSVYRLPLAPGETIEAIAEGIAQAAPERFVLAGFSLGGYVARKVAELYPSRVAALILIATSLRSDSEAQAKSKRDAIASLNASSFRGLSAASIAKSLHPNRRGDKELVSRIRTMGASLGYEAFVIQSYLRRDRIAAASLKCPTLVVAAAQDPLRTREETSELAKVIPDATFVSINDSGHMVPLEQSGMLAREIERWLTSLDAGP